MDADEILRRSRGSGEDEGKEFINRKADLSGFLALCAACFALTVYKVIKDQPVGDVLSLSFIFLSVGMFARYRTDGERFNLIAAIVTGLAAIGFLVSYVVSTW